MTALYLNPCHNEVCYKGTAMYYLCLHNRILHSIFNMGYLLSSANVFYFPFYLFQYQPTKDTGMNSTYILGY